MKESGLKKEKRNIFGDLTFGTSFDLFEADYNLKLLTVKVQCPKCGHVWGIKVDDYNDSEDIPEKKFKCSNCDW